MNQHMTVTLTTSDHNLLAMTAQGSFHGTAAMSIFQIPTTCVKLWCKLPEIDWLLSQSIL